MTDALGNYARWLALSYSRFAEAIPILDSLEDYPERAELLRIARLKQTYLDDSAPSTPTRADARGVTRRPIDFGAFSDLMAFEGSDVRRTICVRTGALVAKR